MAKTRGGGKGKVGMDDGTTELALASPTASRGRVGQNDAKQPGGRLDPDTETGDDDGPE